MTMHTVYFVHYHSVTLQDNILTIIPVNVLSCQCLMSHQQLIQTNQYQSKYHQYTTHSFQKNWHSTCQPNLFTQQTNQGSIQEKQNPGMRFMPIHSSQMLFFIQPADVFNKIQHVLLWWLSLPLYSNINSVHSSSQNITSIYICCT